MTQFGHMHTWQGFTQEDYDQEGPGEWRGTDRLWQLFQQKRIAQYKAASDETTRRAIAKDLAWLSRQRLMIAKRRMELGEAPL